jgi:hypothetical protein
MGTIYLKRKLYTQWDETDNLKRMKDSDILAEKKKTSPGYGSVLSSTAGGAIAGATIGATALGIKHGIKNKSFQGALKGLKRGGKYGALIGGTIMAAGALKRRNKINDENKFYNDRLEYAQRQALRREHADWKANMTQREGYSY